MGMMVSGAGSGLSAGGMAGTLTIKRTKKPTVHNNRNKKPKKKLKYNSREIANQLVRASSSKNASVVLIRAKGKLSVLNNALASGQYNENEVRIAIAHARRMVNCSRLKVRNLKEEELVKGRDEREHSTDEQKKRSEVKRRVRQKERALETKIALKENQQIMKEKKKQLELLRKRLLHRSEEQGKINEADMKYLEAQLKESQNSMTQSGGVVLELSGVAAQLAELLLEEQQIEQQVEMQVEMETAALSAGVSALPAECASPTVSTDAGAAAVSTIDVAV